MRFKLITCEVLYREMCSAIATSPHQIDVAFLEKGLHDLASARMRDRLQAEIDGTDAPGYDAILMGYALCGNGLAGICARTIPLVLIRAHDCIGILMGSRERYLKYIENRSGVFFRSTGWLERGREIKQIFRDRAGAGYTLDELIARYGEENGRYLYEEFTRYERSYKQLTFIQTGLEPDGTFETSAVVEAQQKGWAFEKITGDLSLVRALVSGSWDERDFLVVKPGFRVCARYDDQIFTAEEDQ